jgi:hypothetical protein
MSAVLPHDALFDRVAIDLAGDLAAELLAVGVEDLGKGFVEDGAKQQILGRVAHQSAKLRVDSQKLAIGIDLGNARGGMLVGCGEPPAVLAKPLLVPHRHSDLRNC